MYNPVYTVNMHVCGEGGGGEGEHDEGGEVVGGDDKEEGEKGGDQYARGPQVYQKVMSISKFMQFYNKNLNKLLLSIYRRIILAGTP